MQDYSSDQLYNLGCALLEETLPFSQFPDDLYKKVIPFIGNKAPAHLYCAVWCFEKVLETKDDAQEKLREAKQQLSNEIEKANQNPTIGLMPKTRQAQKKPLGYQLFFQYPPNGENPLPPSSADYKINFLTKYR